jgi:predicted nucleic acid-binding protein
MAYLIDTDVLIDHFSELPVATNLIEKLTTAGIAISIVSYMEVYQGLLRSPERSTAESEFFAFISTVPILPISPAVARRCAELREGLRQDGKRVRARALDLLTASVALEHRLTLVTRNINDFSDIPGLDLYPRDELW